MKKLILILANCALAACQQTTPAPAPTESSAPAPAAAATTADMSGTYDYEYQGKPRVTVIKADGSYEDTVDGKVVENGTYAMKDGKLCMDDKKDPEQCWVMTEPDADGKLTATSADGKIVLQITKRKA